MKYTLRIAVVLAAAAYVFAGVASDNSSPHGAQNAAGERPLYGPSMSDAANLGPGMSPVDMQARGRSACPAGRADCVPKSVDARRGHGAPIRAPRPPRSYLEVMCRESEFECRRTVEGPLARDLVRRVVHRNIAQIRHCYYQALEMRPDLEGYVTAHFIIRGDGRVQTSTIRRSTLGVARVERCVADAIRRWSFPTADGPTVVDFSFHFRSH